MFPRRPFILFLLVLVASSGNQQTSRNVEDSLTVVSIQQRKVKTGNGMCLLKQILIGRSQTSYVAGQRPETSQQLFTQERIEPIGNKQREMGEKDEDKPVVESMETFPSVLQSANVVDEQSSYQSQAETLNDPERSVNMVSKVEGHDENPTLLEKRTHHPESMGGQTKTLTDSRLSSVVKGTKPPSLPEEEKSTRSENRVFGKSRSKEYKVEDEETLQETSSGTEAPPVSVRSASLRLDRPADERSGIAGAKTQAYRVLGDGVPVDVVDEEGEVVQLIVSNSTAARARESGLTTYAKLRIQLDKTLEKKALERASLLRKLREKAKQLSDLAKKRTSSRDTIPWEREVLAELRERSLARRDEKKITRKDEDERRQLKVTLSKKPELKE